MGIISGLLENTNDILYLGKFLFHLVEYFQSSSSHESNVHQKAHGEQAFLQRLLHYLLCGAELLLFVLQIASEQYGHEY